MWIFFGKIETKIGCKYCADDVISAILFCQNAFSPQCNWKDVVKKYDGKNRGVDQRRPATPAGECVYVPPLHFALLLKLTYCIFNKTPSANMTLPLLLPVMTVNERSK